MINVSIFKQIFHGLVFENYFIENSMKIVNWALKILVLHTRGIPYC